MQLKTIFGVLALASLGLTSPTPDVEGFEERDLEERQLGDKKDYCCTGKIDTKDWVINVLWFQIKVAGVGTGCRLQNPSACYYPKVKCKSNFPLDLLLFFLGCLFLSLFVWPIRSSTIH
ncbi:hypothetical protein ASPACDRAFT_64330 [Aspergillus aculeatus ATCC 16872]|uniref:Hydrophobin n=1 Tax=Aspergillus aculeatus (strain ATCC 16872 / CBS 172.66 / WB 5094) TaxID=690307 RepID=A0A1L9WH24_ASPA1|nr:uncharacterized protein ASPACDRAFT_64330 [Aspergillus aculeatus ATCC 16872]OJJ95415.1 hypothetical protein ASPACDRAFT_64330 [Aspergillus aculeatus ATCC 16872]